MNHTNDADDYPKYICKTADLTESNLFDFVDFCTSSSLQEKEEAAKSLSRYGRNADEIRRYMNDHFSQCADCNEEYLKIIEEYSYVKKIFKNLPPVHPPESLLEKILDAAKKRK